MDLVGVGDLKIPAVFRSLGLPSYGHALDAAIIVRWWMTAVEQCNPD